jgi:acyl-CoA oxidase
MLAKYTFVDPNTNKFGRRGSPSLVYGTLTWVRSTIVMQAGSVLARGVTIATRYCAVRRQFQDRDAPAGVDETPVLNYTMVQIRLLPLLAATFALHFTGKSMMDMYQENQKKMLRVMPPTHQASAALGQRKSSPAVTCWQICTLPRVR